MELFHGGLRSICTATPFTPPTPLVAMQYTVGLHITYWLIEKNYSMCRGKHGVGSTNLYTHTKISAQKKQHKANFCCLNKNKLIYHFKCNEHQPGYRYTVTTVTNFIRCVPFKNHGQTHSRIHSIISVPHFIKCFGRDHEFNTRYDTLICCDPSE
jgi:hypothetical protein